MGLQEHAATKEEANQLARTARFHYTEGFRLNQALALHTLRQAYGDERIRGSATLAEHADDSSSIAAHSSTYFEQLLARAMEKRWERARTQSYVRLPATEHHRIDAALLQLRMQRALEERIIDLLADDRLH